MLRLRFLPGLILGLVLGIPAGLLLGMLTWAPRGTAEPAAVSLQVQELTRKLEAATEAKERAERQFEQFQKLAEQMTASFNDLERRFKAMEEEQERRDAQAAQGSQRPTGGTSSAATAALGKPAGVQAVPEAPAPQGLAEPAKAQTSGAQGGAAPTDPAPPHVPMP